MKEDFEYEDRQLIPRFTTSDINRGVTSTSTSNLFKIDDKEYGSFGRLTSQWERSKGQILATEIVSSSLVLGKVNEPIVHEAISLLEKGDLSTNPTMRNILSLVKLENGGIELPPADQLVLNRDIYEKIASLKKVLLENPSNSIAWVDIGYYYTVLGQLRKAERCIENALSINHHNAYVVRSAARFFLHTDNIERSLWTLRSSPRFLHNPWLLSAEISISQIADVKSKAIKKAVEFSSSTSISPFELTELRGALATVEFQTGNAKTGKRLLSRSLEMPNENVLAQSFFLHEQFSSPFEPDLYDIPLKFEADTWKHYRNGDFQLAVEEVFRWFTFQPFSSQPAILLSYLLAVLFEEYDKASEVLRRALITSPDNTMLLNNLAYVQVRTGRFEEAGSTISNLKKLAADDPDIATFFATEGYLLIRTGHLADGTRLYEKAISEFKNQGNTISHSRALYFYAQAVEEVEPAKSLSLLKEAVLVGHKHNFKEIAFLASKKNLEIV